MGTSINCGSSLIAYNSMIQSIFKIINNEMDSWNAIGKHWLQKYDNKFGVLFFLCKCPDIKGSDIASIPKYYRDAIQAWSFSFWGHVLRSLEMTF